MKGFHDENLKEQVKHFEVNYTSEDKALLILTESDVTSLKAACDLLWKKKDVTEIERETCRSILVGLPGGWPKR